MSQVETSELEQVYMLMMLDGTQLESDGQLVSDIVQRLVRALREEWARPGVTEVGWSRVLRGCVQTPYVAEHVVETVWHLGRILFHPAVASEERLVVYRVLAELQLRQRDVLASAQPRGAVLQLLRQQDAHVLQRIRTDILSWPAGEEVRPECFHAAAIRFAQVAIRAGRLPAEELSLLDGAFVRHLLALVQHTYANVNFEHSSYAQDTVRLLVALHEQYLLVRSSELVENQVLFVLCQCLDTASSFGQCLIHELNEESGRGSSSSGSPALSAEEEAEDARDASAVKLLLLKCIFSIVDTPALSHYFYTNDLRVLIDVVVRELYNLPELDRLRPVYLRVLPRLLLKTQYGTELRGYKSAEIQQCLTNLRDAYARSVASVQAELAQLSSTNNISSSSNSAATTTTLEALRSRKQDEQLALEGIRRLAQTALDQISQAGL